jgi:hypothetical protein
MIVSQPKTMREALSELDTENVRQLGRLFGPVPATRKQDRIEIVLRGLEGEGLKWALDKLDDLSRKAVTEAAYDPDGIFRESVFSAKYGHLTGSERIYTGRGNTFLEVFLIRGYIPGDLQERVRKILPPPPEVNPRTFRELPPAGDGSKLIAVETETAALRDCLLILHLISEGGVKVTPAKQEVSAAGKKAILNRLSSGDFPALTPNQGTKESIRPHIWPYILIIARLDREGAEKLELIREGLRALEQPPHKSIRLAWEHWMKTDRYDEIEDIGVDYSQFRLNKPLERRRRIIDMLLLHPPGEWIDVEDLHRLLLARKNGLGLESMYRFIYYATYDISRLTRQSEEFQKRLELWYIQTFLWEIAGTLGLLDLAYTPQNTPSRMFIPYIDFGRLKYVRITPLGEYCFGRNPSYAEEPSQAAIKVLPTLEVVMPDKERHIRWESFFLERVAERTADHVWKLDRKKILSTLEQGIPLDRIRKILESGGPLPDTVARFIHEISLRETALAFTGEAVLFEARDAATADLIAHERKLQGLCLRAGGKSVVVPDKTRNEFLKTMKGMGYLVRMPKE